MGQPSDLCCSDLAISLLFPPLCHILAPANQNSPRELFLYRSLLFQLPSPAGVPGRSYFRACVFYRRFSLFYRSRDFLHEARCWATICFSTGRNLTIGVSGALLV